MSIFKKLFSKADTGRYLRLYAKCDRCGEILEARIDMYNDLSVEYGDGGKSESYICRKVLIGSKRCYIPIEIKLTFDSKKNLADKQISAGSFVTEEEFESFIARS